MTTKKRSPLSPLPFLALLALTLFFAFPLPSDLIAAESTVQATSIAADPNTAPPCRAVQESTSPNAAGDKEQETGTTTPEEEANIRAMNQRYGQDATGVRARLGMCRQGQGGQGRGYRHRFRGGNQWNQPQ